MNVSATQSSDDDVARSAVVKDTARRQLVELGAAGLSLDLVARGSGLAVTDVEAVFPHRDDLLTALVIDAYDASGAAMERADRAGARPGGAGGGPGAPAAPAPGAVACTH
ncbi:hypothetical protein ACFXC7_06000, partial [Streptomyces virginiae]